MADDMNNINYQIFGITCIKWFYWHTYQNIIQKQLLIEEHENILIINHQEVNHWAAVNDQTTKSLETLDISGSEAMRFVNLVMHATPSNIPSSMLMSSTCAPFSTWVFATFKASWKVKHTNEPHPLEQEKLML